MNKEPRPPKHDDNNRIQEGIELYYEMMAKNPQIEVSLWASVTIFVLVNGYKQCDYSYEEFRSEIDIAFDHYKFLFD